MGAMEHPFAEWLVEQSHDVGQGARFVFIGDAVGRHALRIDLAELLDEMKRLEPKRVLLMVDKGEGHLVEDGTGSPGAFVAEPGPFFESGEFFDRPAGDQQQAVARLIAFFRRVLQPVGPVGVVPGQSGGRTLGLGRFGGFVLREFAPIEPDTRHAVLRLIDDQPANANAFPLRLRRILSGPVQSDQPAIPALLVRVDPHAGDLRVRDGGGEHDLFPEMLAPAAFEDLLDGDHRHIFPEERVCLPFRLAGQQRQRRETHRTTGGREFTSGHGAPPVRISRGGSIPRGLWGSVTHG